MITPIAQMSTGFPCPPTQKMSEEKDNEGYNRLLLKISGAIYYKGDSTRRRRGKFDIATHPRRATNFSQHI